MGSTRCATHACAIRRGTACFGTPIPDTPAWHWDMAWAQHALDFTATTSATNLRFTSLETTPWGPALDSMKVELLTASVPASDVLALARVTPDPLSTSGRLEFSLPQAGRVRLADDESTPASRDSTPP